MKTTYQTMLAFSLVSAITNSASAVDKDTVMKPQAVLQLLAGQWEGTSRTWAEPGKLMDESEIAGEFKPVLGEGFLRHSYKSSMKGKPRAGEETIAFNAVTKRFQVSWFDTFHMSTAIMFSEGTTTSSGFEVTGSYDTGPDTPPWGWKTVFEFKDDDHLVITAYNITPDGQEAKAVETDYRRVK